MIIENGKFTDACESVLQRLDEECEAAKEGMKDAYFAVADCIRQRLAAEPALAGKMQGKTVKGAYEEIYKAAQEKHKKGGGNCVFIPPDQASAIITRYCFGEDAAAAAPVQTQPTKPQKEEKSEIVDLFDLI